MFYNLHVLNNKSNKLIFLYEFLPFLYDAWENTEKMFWSGNQFNVTLDCIWHILISMAYNVSKNKIYFFSKRSKSCVLCAVLVCVSVNKDITCTI